MKNFRIHSVLIVAALSVTACQQIETKTEIGKVLYDKKAARWGTIRHATFFDDETGKEVSGTCGYVNSKNRHGAYTGYTSFVYIPKNGVHIITAFYDGRDDATFEIVWYRSCKGMQLKGGR